MNKDWGVVRPVYGRWVWPFRRMEEGDWFHVDHADRDPEQVRNMAMVRAHQLGMKFSVNRNDEDKPGFCKVTRVALEHEEPDNRQPVMEYGSAKERFMDWYAVDLDVQMPMAQVSTFEAAEIKAEQIEKPHRQRVVFKFLEHVIGAELFEDRIRFVPLPKGWKPATWEAKYDQWEQDRPAYAEAQRKEREAVKRAMEAPRNPAMSTPFRKPEGPVGPYYGHISDLKPNLPIIDPDDEIEDLMR
jgi:hypothetical protein